jgi:CDP-diacylglycerol pyrophosphatase
VNFYQCTHIHVLTIQLQADRSENNITIHLQCVRDTVNYDMTSFSTKFGQIVILMGPFYGTIPAQEIEYLNKHFDETLMMSFVSMKSQDLEEAL